MGNSILNDKNSQVMHNNNTWLSYYYILAIYYLGHCLLLDWASLPWQTHHVYRDMPWMLLKLGEKVRC